MADHAAARVPRGQRAASRRDATAFASGPVAPSGPTQDGQPDSHGTAVDQLARPRDQLLVHAKSGSLKPMPPG